MPGYNFLNGLKVIEYAQLGPASLGGYLADMGAEVIKIEDGAGDPLRFSGTPAVGSPQGAGFMHLRWNRGKKSLGLNLKNESGKNIFKYLAANADVVIEGMRAGALDSLGLGYESLKESNPKLVYCSLSGLGRDGPYSALGSHGPSFDAFGALSDINPYGLSPEERKKNQCNPIGMHAMGLNAAVGTLAAVIRAKQTGVGAIIEVTGAESAAHWLPDSLNSALNKEKLFDRPGFLNSKNKMAGWPRLCSYHCADGKRVFFQALSPKFWQRFCEAIKRPDLLSCYQDMSDSSDADEFVHAELVKLIRTQNRDYWIQFFQQEKVPGGPANTPEELCIDPHFTSRNNTYRCSIDGVGELELSGTPIKTDQQHFAPEAAPELSQHSKLILRNNVGLSDEEINTLLAENAIFVN